MPTSEIPLTSGEEGCINTYQELLDRVQNQNSERSICSLKILCKSLIQDNFVKIDYHKHYHESGDLADLHRSIESYEEPLALEPQGDQYPCLIAKLGELYRCRYMHPGSYELRDLEKSIECTSFAIELSPGDCPDLYNNLTWLSDSFHLRFHHTMDFGDLDREIDHRMRALSLKPAGDPSLFHSLGHTHRTRFYAFKSPSDLEHAIEYSTLSASLTPYEDPALLERLDQIAGLYYVKSSPSSTLNDVEKGLEFMALAVSLTPEGDSNLPVRLMDLSFFYRERCFHLSNPSDLDKSIECVARVVSLTPEDHDELPRRLQKLMSLYNQRFEILKDLNDLDKAMEHGSRGISIGCKDSTHFNTLVTLSDVCHSRFESRGEPEDLERGIEYNARALSLTANSFLATMDPGLEPFRLNILGALYATRAKYLADPDDLDQAIECVKSAISLAPIGDEGESVRAASLSCLSSYIHRRWHLIGYQSDLEEGIRHANNAVSLFTPQLHPNLPTELLGLGTAHLSWSKISDKDTGSPLLRRALEYFHQACDSAGPPHHKMEAARRWAGAARGFDMAECLEGYQTAMELIPQVIWLGDTLDKRYNDARDLRSLAAEAASAAILAHDYRSALEWLEQGRTIVMHQSLLLRSPLDQLYGVDPSLAERLEQVSKELHTNSSETRNSRSKVLKFAATDSDEISHRHRHLAKEHADLISRVRQLTGFENFLKPKQVDELTRVALTGPVVIVNFYEPQGHCDALIIRPGDSEIAHLGLKEFTPWTIKDIRARVGTSLARGDLTERGADRRPVVTDQRSDIKHVLAVLWKDIVKPVLDFLGYKPHPPPGGLPHITWYTTGDLSSLPLHAAGLYEDHPYCVSDYAISSYAPSLTALLTSAPYSMTAPGPPSILTVGQVETPGHSRLPGTLSELAHIRLHAGDTVPYTELTGSEATASAVLDAMERHDWVHLACHAHQNVGDPTESGFFLHDGALDLTSIMRRTFKNKGLAFLSACQTAMGDERLPDETVHLASGMLTAGFPSVIATMWSVWDKDAPFVADRVYEYLLKGGIVNHRESAKALHYAIRELRKEIGDENFERWVPFIHIGS
ncbi:CHAT domain-containing protein [Rhizoctonia solani]|nr:CHAT domain-containing protein [Rhizoctonia solani]